MNIYLLFLKKQILSYQIFFYKEERRKIARRITVNKEINVYEPTFADFLPNNILLLLENI